MRISEQVPAHDAGTAASDAAGLGSPVDWAEQTRSIVTRELLVRASQSRDRGGQDLRFRALHLNLSLVAEVAGRLGLAELLPQRVEHAALDGLHQAVRLYDPFGEMDFATFATPLVEWQIRSALQRSAPGPTTRTPSAFVRTISRKEAREARR